MDQDAQKYLVQQLADVQAGLPLTDNAQRAQDAFRGFMITLAAFRAVNVISSDEAHEWTNRLLVRLGREPLEPFPSGFSGAQAIDFSGREVPTPPVDSRIDRFLGLTPADSCDQPLPSGGRVQILGIERYESKIAVAWRLAPIPDPEVEFAEELSAHDRNCEGLPEQERKMMRQQLIHRLGFRSHHDIGVSDDVGTRYLRTGGGGGGANTEMVGRTEFVPAIPSGASILNVRWGALNFAILLPERIDPGRIDGGL